MHPRSARLGHHLRFAAITFLGLCTPIAASEAATHQVPLHYPTIQEAIDASAPGDSIVVSSGIYEENLHIHTSVTIIGTGENTIIYPAVSDTGPPTPPSFGHSQLAVVEATNVRLQELCFDGDSPTLTPPGQLDARNGIITNYNTGDWHNLRVDRCLVKNIYLRGIYASAQSQLSGVVFSNNQVENVRAVPYQSAGIMFYGTAGAVTTNTASNCSIGIMNHAASVANILDNTLLDCDTGIAVNGNVSLVHVYRNTVINFADSGIQTVEPRAEVEIYDNNIYTGAAPTQYDQFCIYVFGHHPSYAGDQLISGNVLGLEHPGDRLGGDRREGAQPVSILRPPVALDAPPPPINGERDLSRYGIGVDTYGWSSSMDVHARIYGNTISGLDFGVALVDAAGNTAPWMDVTIGGSESDANTFSENTAEELLLAVIDDDINARFNDWGVYNPVAIEEEIWHQVDDPALGLVDFSDYIVPQGVDTGASEATARTRLRLLQNQPNPFGGHEETTLAFHLPRESSAVLRIYDIDGRTVQTLARGRLGAGEHRVSWRGADQRGNRLPSGIYLYRLDAEGERSLTRKLVLMPE